MPRFQITGQLDINYYLVLNNMRDKAESRCQFGPYESKEAALAYHDSQLADQVWEDTGASGIEPYFNNQVFRKSFKKGSNLEWMNPLQPTERDEPGFFGHGVFRVLENLDIQSQTRLG